MNGKMVIANTPYGSLWFYNRKEKIDKIKTELEELTWESEVTKVVETFEYDTFIDIGAGFGYYCMMASPYANKVVGIEPHPLRYGLAKWNTLGLDNVTLVEGAVGGQPYVNFHSLSDMASSKGNVFSYPLKTKVYSSVLSMLPYFEEDQKVLIKIDVEGFEVEVLKDFFRYFSSDWMKIFTFIIEVHPKWKHLDVRYKDVLPFFDYGYWKVEKIGTRNHILAYWEESNA